MKGYERRRIVVEVQALPGITEGSVRRMVETMLGEVKADRLRHHGVIPSSVKVKRYSHVVASEYGAVPGDAFDEEAS